MMKITTAILPALVLAAGTAGKVHANSLSSKPRGKRIDDGSIC